MLSWHACRLVDISQPYRDGGASGNLYGQFVAVSCCWSHLHFSSS